jgi:NTP pyrophosphatase (non-canonical NTP hydrolase)
MAKESNGFGFETSEYAKKYEDKAKAFAEDAQSNADYSVQEAKETVERMKNARTENMRMEVDFPKYVEFVDGMTSRETKSTETWIERIRTLQEGGLEVSRLTTAAVGLSAEAGEFQEIVKKMLFQGKPWNEDNKEHLIIELGDVMWYVSQACIALGVGIDDVIWKNTMKLAKRYPSGGFDVSKSENRQAGDR